MQLYFVRTIKVFQVAAFDCVVAACVLATEKLWEQTTTIKKAKVIVL